MDCTQGGGSLPKVKISSSSLDGSSGFVKYHSLKVLYANCRSLNNKIHELEQTSGKLARDSTGHA